MSKRKKWMLAGLLSGLVILAMGLGATAYAASSDSSSQKADPRETFISKVAGILGLDESTVSDAMTQARDEMQQEAQQDRLNKAVEDGVITQEEADAISAWWQARPDALDKLEGPRHGPGPDMQCPPGMVDSQERLNKAVGAPSEAWRFLRGESPCWARSNQPPIPSVAAV